MGSFKFIFNENGTTEKIENYIPDEEEINELKAYDAAILKEAKEEKENVDESEMSIEEIKAWTFAKARGESYEEFREHWDKKASSTKTKTKSKINTSTIASTNISVKENIVPKTPRHKARKTGHQTPHTNMRGTEAVARTYLIELQCLKKLEKIKLLHLDNEYIQYSEIINDAIDCYYEIWLEKNNLK